MKRTLDCTVTGHDCTMQPGPSPWPDMIHSKMYDCLDHHVSTHHDRRAHFSCIVYMGNAIDERVVHMLSCVTDSVLFDDFHYNNKPAGSVHR